ncbi:hypothetical protein G6M89_21150 [Natronolimnobius sp. AArcel1]|uniref:hypothetical protein n=1 Tax=Natronolimnobius sp. AArcel1 TaxID=1679093 RepID=UPI0013ED1235|nr:hypothetical protein [Natronolimnobius sp. AArcel1]NGM71459.1 hypothetical protein [Natronolimnobius sp. AArcel1]
MSEDLHEELTDVLDRASAERESLLASDEQSDGDTETDSSGLLEAADDASDLLESNEPGDVLEALELDTLPDGSDASSIPEAIAEGDKADVATLQQLLRLANLADHDAAELDGALESLRDGIDAGTDDNDDAEAEVTPADSDGDSSDDAEAETPEDTDGEPDESDSSDTTFELTEQLRSSMKSSLSDFSEDIGSLQDGLEAVQSGLSDSDESDGDAADGDATDDDESAPDTDEERTADSEGEEDDDLLEADLEPDLGGERGNSAGGDGTRHSTMAPSPSKRADMKGTARFSTMPDRN